MQTFTDRAREVMAERGLGSNELNRAMGKGCFAYMHTPKFSSRD